MRVTAMGRKKIFEFEKYVTIDEENMTLTCIICKKILKGKISGNVKRHYETMHNIKINCNESDQQPSSSSVSRKNSNNSMLMDKNEFLLCCVGLVTVKNIPFRIFDDDEYFKKILRPYEDFHKTNINSKNIVCKIDNVAKKIKESISQTVFKKMMCLKIDVATRMEKNILGINIQYIKDSRIHINTIGMVQLKKRHTAQFLKEEIVNCLKDFNIDISQIYSCTSDNGANVIKTSKLLQELQEEVLTQDTDDPLSDDEDFNEIHSSLSSVMAVVRCAAHTIQLAAHDVLKVIQPEVEECRKIVKNLRTIVRNENPANIQMPLIDNATRWNSTFKMIQSLKNLKEYIENINLSNNSEPDWNFINKFLNAFKPLSECTNKFQFEQYLVGDFYRDWLCCEVELEELVNDENIYAQKLLDAMKKRKLNLLRNEAFLSAIYLDPRFNFITTPFLSEEQKKIAVKHLLKTQDMINRLSGQNTASQNLSIVSSVSPSTSAFSKLEAKMNLLINETPPTDRTTKQKLENLSNAERVSFETNILEYWGYTYTKTNDPDMRQLLDVALAVPSTQVSVERAFSALSVILTKMRAKLSKDTINNLLIVKLNKNMLKNVIIVDENSGHK